MSDNDNLWVNVSLTGNTLALFRRIREEYGVGFNAEAIRIMIRNEARRLGLAEDRGVEVVVTATAKPGA